MAASTRRISHSGHADPCCVNCNIVAVIRRRYGRPGEIPGHQQLATPRKSSPPGTAYPRPPNPVLHAMQLSPEFEPGHHLPAAPPPSPPRGQSGHEPESPPVFRVPVGLTQLRHTRATAISDLHPDGADAGSYGDRDRLPWDTRAAVLETIGEKLAHKKYGVIPAGMPRAKDRTHERADNPCPLRQSGNLHALANRRPSHQRTAFPSALEDPQGPERTHGDSRSPQPRSSSRMHIACGSPERQPGTPAASCSRRKPGSRTQSGISEQEILSDGKFPLPEKRLTMPFHFIMAIIYTAETNAGQQRNGGLNGTEGKCAPRR